jgi:hypothetical protein
LKSKSSSRILQRRRKKLETMAFRIETRMARLEKIVAELSQNLQGYEH